jgi:hypothetical protein
MTENFVKVFEGKKDFEALYAAEQWCRDNGISYGPTCAAGPQALLFGDYSIAKWRNLTAKERKQVHGVIEDSLREGPVTLRIKAEFRHLLKVFDEN